MGNTSSYSNKTGKDGLNKRPLPGQAFQKPGLPPNIVNHGVLTREKLLAILSKEDGGFIVAKKIGEIASQYPEKTTTTMLGGEEFKVVNPFTSYRQSIIYAVETIVRITQHDSVEGKLRGHKKMNQVLADVLISNLEIVHNILKTGGKNKHLLVEQLGENVGKILHEETDDIIDKYSPTYN